MIKASKASKVSKSTALTTLDNLQLINKLFKADLDRLALNLKTDLNRVDKMTMLRKFEYLIKKIIEDDKDFLIEYFQQTYGGSSYEIINGCGINLKSISEYEYSENVKDLESEIKMLQEQCKQMKEKERKNGTAKKINQSEIISITLK